MNPKTAREAVSLASAIAKATKNVSRKIDIVLTPPFPFLSLITNHLSLKLGAQDVFWEAKGAFTGEVSADQLKSLGVKYVIPCAWKRQMHANIVQRPNTRYGNRSSGCAKKGFQLNLTTERAINMI